MTRLTSVMMLAGVAAAGIGSAVVLAQDNLPGRPSIARMLVLNRAREEAIPVTLRGGDVQPVALIGTPLVTLAPNATIAARATRQSWEYQSIQLRAGSDPTTVLNAAGSEGWEAIGAVVPVPGTTTSTILMKRPR